MSRILCTIPDSFALDLNHTNSTGLLPCNHRRKVTAGISGFKQTWECPTETRSNQLTNQLPAWAVLTVDRERLFFPEGFAGCMQACAFGRSLIWWIDRSLTTKIFGLFTGSNVRGGRPQLAEHNLLAVGHRLRYRRDRHGHLPSRVSIPTISFVSLFYSLLVHGPLDSFRCPRMQLHSRKCLTRCRFAKLSGAAPSYRAKSLDPFILTSHDP